MISPILLACKWAHTQTKKMGRKLAGDLKQVGRKLDLRSVHKKTMIMKWKVSSGIKIQIQGKNIEETEKFMSLDRSGNWRS